MEPGCRTTLNHCSWKNDDLTQRKLFGTMDLDKKFLQKMLTSNLNSGKGDTENPRKKRPDRRLYIPPGRRCESEKVELHRGGAYRHPDTHENEGCSSRLQTPSLNGQQTRAQTNSCQKERTCESEANSGCGMGDLAISLKNFRESMKNSLADLTTTTTDLPDVNIVAGLEIEEEDGGKLATAIVARATSNGKYAITAAHLCIGIVQKEISRRTSSFQDQVIDACMAIYYEWRDRWCSLALFCGKLLSGFEQLVHPGWSVLPLIVLNILEELLTSPTTASDEFTLWLMAEVLCLCGKQLEMERYQRVKGIMFIARQAILSKTTSINLRTKLLQVLELKASGWKLDEATIDFFKKKLT